VIFIVGGATYEEARMVAQLNAANKSQRIILGGTTMLNSASFIADLHTAISELR
jgi:vacuolar protein sorting-associated protein 45